MTPKRAAEIQELEERAREVLAADPPIPSRFHIIAVGLLSVIEELRDATESQQVVHSMSPDSKRPLCGVNYGVVAKFGFEHRINCVECDKIVSRR